MRKLSDLAIGAPFLSAIVVLNVAALANARSLPTDSSGVVLRDVEVVSVKRTLNTPLEPVTSISSATVRELDIKAVNDIGVIAPNFYMPQYGSRMTSSIYVRGMGTRIDQPVVGLNVDNVPYLNKDNFDFDMFDIDKVEIIRGSVGVLTGRNSIGGQINVSTLSPWKFNGVRAMAQYGNGNTVSAGAGWYGKLGRRVATSVTAYYNHTDGFFRNEYNNHKVGRENTGNFRWKLSWHPDSRWSLMNVAGFGLCGDNGYPYASAETGKIAYNDSTFYKRLSFNDGLTVTYTGKRIIATSVTSFQYIDDDMTLDQDFLPEDYFTLQQKRKDFTFTQDLYTKGIRDHYSWLFGLFGFYKKSDMHAPVNFKNTGLERLIEDNVNGMIPPGMHLAFDERNLLLDSNFDIFNGGFALYHQSAVRFGGFTAQIGLRWDIERVSLHYSSDADAAMTMYRQLPTGVMMPLATQELAVHDHGRLHRTFNQILPQAAIGYENGCWQVSARVAKGYKAGGYNTQMFSDILQQQLMEQAGVEASYDTEAMLTYKPEKAWTYEITGRFADPGRRIDVEAVLFLMKIRDQQLTVFPNGNTTGRAMTNAGRTRSMGVEITARYSPVEQLSLSAAYGFTNAVFTKYNNGHTDMKGNHLPFAPAHTLFANASYAFPQVWKFRPVLSVHTRCAGKIYWDDTNEHSQKFYAVPGASLAFEHAKGSLTLWTENFTDTRYNTFYFESIGHAFVQRANPVTYGVTVRMAL